VDAVQIIHLICWWDVLCVVYRDTASTENEVKILEDEEKYAMYLTGCIGTAVAISELIANDVPWVDESKFFGTGVEVKIELDDENANRFQEFCRKYEIAQQRFLYGVSCFLCNPAHKGLAIHWIEEAFRGMLQSNSEV